MNTKPDVAVLAIKGKSSQSLSFTFFNIAPVGSHDCVLCMGGLWLLQIWKREGYILENFMTNITDQSIRKITVGFSCSEKCTKYLCHRPRNA